MVLIRVLRYHLMFVMKPINILLLLSVFIINTSLVYSTYTTELPEKHLKAISFMFYLPINLNLDIFRYLLIVTPFLIILGSFINSELKERSTNLLLQMRSYYYWLHSIVIVCLLFIVLNLLLGFLITGGLVLLLPEESMSNNNLSFLRFFHQTNNSSLIINQFLLINLSLFLMVLLNILLVFLFDNTSVAFLISIISLIISIVVGYISPNLLKWLPLTYGMLASHEISNYSFEWAYTFIMSSILIIYLLIILTYKYRRELIFHTKEI